MKAERKTILQAHDAPYEGPDGFLLVAANGDMAAAEALFAQNIEQTLKWLARYGLIANRRPCPRAATGVCPAGAAPPSDMNLVKQSSTADGYKASNSKLKMTYITTKYVQH